ncbi:hypothetical protein ACRAVF_07875 [Bradyrhizobium oligotrophicum S58]
MTRNISDSPTTRLAAKAPTITSGRVTLDGIARSFTGSQKQACQPAEMVSKNTAVPYCTHIVTAPMTSPIAAIPAARAGVEAGRRARDADGILLGR